MSSRQDIDQLKKSIQQDIANSDVDNFLKNSEKFFEHIEKMIKEYDTNGMEKTEEEFKKPITERLIPTYHEFVLFLVVVAFVISVFG